MAYFRKNLAIDLGTTSIRIYTRSQGVILNEPSVVAIDVYTDKIIAIGQEAKDMLGRAPGNIEALKPINGGVVADYKAAEKMLRYFIKKACGRTVFGPNVIMSVPSKATQVQKRAILQAVSAAGAHNISLIEAPLAAALGHGVDADDPSGDLVVDIGGGKLDVALISLGGIVLSKSSPIAGNEFDKAVSEYIRKKFGIIIGERTAEEIKIRIGSSASDEMEETMEVKGRGISDGLPVHIYISSADVNEALEQPIEAVVNTIHEVLADTPPELSSDLFDRGIILTGGGSLVRGLAQRIQNRIGIEVKLVENPLTAVVRGTGRALTWIKKIDSKDEVFSQSIRQKVMSQESLRKR